MIRGLNSPGGIGLPANPRAQQGGQPPTQNQQQQQQQFYDDEPYQANASRFPFGGGVGKIVRNILKFGVFFTLKTTKNP